MGQGRETINFGGQRSSLHEVKDRLDWR